ncbi:MAG: IPT/TIG domain-containing protein [Elusimicrobiales bacterium]|nr:IPT/TIG domain-containing protein [Elusimicrobiales bacterium]
MQSFFVAGLLSLMSLSAAIAQTSVPQDAAAQTGPAQKMRDYYKADAAEFEALQEKQSVDLKRILTRMQTLEADQKKLRTANRQALHVMRANRFGSGGGAAAITPSSAPVGALFTVTGSGFGDSASTNTVVLIGGTTASMTLWTESRIQGTLPYLTTGQYPVVVRRYAGNTIAQTYITIVAPTITAASPQTAEAGGAFTLTGTAFGGYSGGQLNGKPAARVMVDGSAVCALSSWTDSQIRGIIPDDTAAGPHTFTVVREGSGGAQASNAAGFTTGGNVSAARALASASNSYDPTAGLLLPASWGGAVESASRAAVSVPANALASDTVISIATAAISQDAAALMFQSENKIYIKPVGQPVTFGPADLTLASPATLTIPFDRAQIPYGKTERDLAVYKWDDAAQSWQKVASTLKNGRLVAQAQQLSLYQAMAQGVNQAASEVFALRQFYVYPNPAKNGNSPKLHLECGVGDGYDVRIYDVAGELRHSAHFDGPPQLGTEYNYEYVWDMNGAGSGVYTAVMEAHKAGEGNIRAKKKFAIVR